MNYYQAWDTGIVRRTKKMIDIVINHVLELSEKENYRDIKKYSLDEIISDIQSRSTAEIYHAVSIEGYETTLEEVECINHNIFPNQVTTDEEKNMYLSLIKERIIIQSYKQALEMVLKEYVGKNKIIKKEDLVKINYYEFIEAYKLNNLPLIEHNYRNHTVYMRSCENFTPVKTLLEIDELIDYLFLNIERIENEVLKAIALHFLLAPIQPFADGNGRLSRFIMNIALSNAGYKWISIDNHKYRLRYLSSYGYINTEEYDKLLKVFDDFVLFIINYLK